MSVLAEETTKLDGLVLKVETAIDRLLEYRTALTSAAVTGKIDVRDVSPAAPAADSLENTTSGAEKR